MNDVNPNKELSDIDLFWLSRAIEISRISADKGGSPFGAVVAQGPSLLGEGGNETITMGLPIRHAEVVALEAALIAYGGVLPGQATLYSSCAPCVMCIGTTFYAGVRRIVYALKIADVVPLGSGDPKVEPEIINDTLNLGLQLHGGALHSEALHVVMQTFQKRGYL